MLLRSCVVFAVLGASAAAAACSTTTPVTPPTPADVPTHVDCVAVLGTNPPYAEMPLASVPVSGIARDKLIGSLSDDELGRFCDYQDCLGTNGYARVCYSQGNGRQIHDPPLPLLAGLGTTCLVATGTESSGAIGDISRDDCRQVMRNYFGSCHVGSWEDSVRDRNWAPFGAADWALKSPPYLLTLQECPVE